MLSPIKIRPNDERSRILLILLRIVTLFLLFRVVFELYRFSVWSKVYDGYNITERLLKLVAWIEWIFLGLQFLLFVATLTLFILWMKRSYENMVSLRLSVLKRKSYWAIWGWFVPVVNLFIPIQMIGELVKRYEQFLISRDYVRHYPARRIIIGWWWFTLLMASILLILSFMDGLAGYFYAAVSTVFFFISGLLSLSMISKVCTLEEGVRDQKDITVVMGDTDELLDVL